MTVELAVPTILTMATFTEVNFTIILLAATALYYWLMVELMKIFKKLVLIEKGWEKVLYFRIVMVSPTSFTHDKLAVKMVLTELFLYSFVVTIDTVVRVKIIVLVIVYDLKISLIIYLIDS